jgi:hypothetical protein
MFRSSPVKQRRRAALIYVIFRKYLKNNLGNQERLFRGPQASPSQPFHRILRTGTPDRLTIFGSLLKPRMLRSGPGMSPPTDSRCMSAVRAWSGLMIWCYSSRVDRVRRTLGDLLTVAVREILPGLAGKQTGSPPPDLPGPAWWSGNRAAHR